MRLWHRRMGHLSPHAIDSMERQNLVNGLEISIPQEFDHICSGCVNAKSHRFPFSESSNTHYSKMDLTGPMSVPTWDGFFYALVVVEVSCRYPVGRLLRTKEDTGVTVHDISLKWSNQCSILQVLAYGTEERPSPMPSIYKACLSLLVYTVLSPIKLGQVVSQIYLTCEFLDL